MSPAERLAESAQEAGVPGAVLGVLVDGEVTVHATGVLSTRTGVPVTADSVFQIGSITKTWTATMVAQLVEEGRLSYDATAAEVLPGVRLGREDAADRITVRHLLSHTSGVDGDVFVDTGRGADCVERYVGLLADVESVTEPGEVYSYCNSGFVVLGRMVEVLDGRSWDESLRARLSEPSGLQDVCTLPEEAILRRAAVGHHELPDSDRPYDEWGLPRSLGPAGLITTTAADLLGYARLHLGDRYPELRVPQVDLPEPGALTSTGLGWRLGTWSGRPVLAHDGGTLGQSAMLRLVPSRGVAVCLLTNSANGGGLYERLVPELVADVAGVDVPGEPVPDHDAHPDLGLHVGRYRRRAADFEVRLDDDRLVVRVVPRGDLEELDDGPRDVPMLPSDDSGDRFVGRTDDRAAWWPVTFGTLSDGRSYLSSSGRIALRV